MSLWETLTGRKPSQAQSVESPRPSSNPEPYKPPSFDMSTTQGIDPFLGSSAFADPTRLHPLLGLDRETLEYISLDDSALSDLPGAQSVLPSRGFFDDLCYGTGATYITGLTMGGAWGLQEGLRRSTDQPPKLRLNSVLNAVTRRGPFLGNSAGVIAITYNTFNSAIGAARGKHDAANSIAAGLLSGLLFQSTNGLRRMAYSGAMAASVAGAWAITRRILFPIPEPRHREKQLI